MTQPVIQVKDLSKCYQIRSTTQKPYHSLREDLVDGFKGLLRGQWGRSQSEDFWALKDVSFDVNQGEVVGIIGRNGAGKSTLLKILSRIVRPTSGEVVIRGRVGSLLEVGTGFHPELTGRENIFMNGAVLGMKRSEIVRKFDEIVAFAEVEKFLDTPVKFYSSGMYVRLAFAVAAHLEPEILIVDEVLAVGDAQFQKKCLGKMEEVTEKEGRTVLFVSHNTGSIRAICKRGLLLKNGELIVDSDAESTINSYLGDNDLEAHIVWNEENAPKSTEIQFLEAYIINDKDESISIIDHTKEFSIVLKYYVLNIISGLRIGILIKNIEGVVICGATNFKEQKELVTSSGFYIVRCTFPSHLLNTGKYLIQLGADKFPYTERLVLTDFCLTLTVEDTEGHGYQNQSLPGILRPKLEWQSSKESCSFTDIS
jgi:lipopolysaccharide transport system ATP-binding protein